MDLTKIGLYVLAGYGAYALYDRYMGKGAEATSSFSGTAWQRKGYGGTSWQQAPYSNLVGTAWQRSGYRNACGTCS